MVLNDPQMIAFTLFNSMSEWRTTECDMLIVNELNEHCTSFMNEDLLTNTD